MGNCAAKNIDDVDNLRGERESKAQSMSSIGFLNNKKDPQAQWLEQSVRLQDFLLLRENFDLSKKSGRARFSQAIDYENWYVIKLLGQGAVAKVFLVAHYYTQKDEKITKFYAMKIQSKSLIIENDIENSIMSERNLLLELETPFVLKMHYAFQSKKSLFLIVDYCPGGDLMQKLIEKSNFNESAVRYYGA